jgi:hypothetical protein
MASTLDNAPSARTFSIPDLVRAVVEGRVRIPNFQRNYRWRDTDVTRLFDSIYRGYPIGGLLLWLRPAAAETVEVGPLRVEANATETALWVVDGQQRITSLAGALAHVGETDDLRFSIYFDLEAQRFLSGRRKPSPHWLPLNRVIDTRALLRWLGDAQRAGATDELVTRAEDVAKRIRDYQIPASVVDTADEETLRTIFDRLNTFGKSLKSSEVFQALHGGRSGNRPEDLRTLGHDLQQLGFGELDQNTVLRAVLAVRAPDVYRDFRNEFRDDEDPSETFRVASEALEKTVAFLRSQAAFPHIRVLPYRFVLPVLTRFFALHPRPHPRSLTLLRRWLWRDAISSGRRSTSVTEFREAVAAVGPDEEVAVQALLSRAKTEPPERMTLSPRLNEALARANVALLGSWSPRSLIDGTVIDLSELFENERQPLGTVVVPTGSAPPSLANRVLHFPTSSPFRDLLVDSPLRKSDPTSFREVLYSHAIPEDAVHNLVSGESGQFIEARRVELERRLTESAARFAEWGRSDRPSISALVVSDDDD